MRAKVLNESPERTIALILAPEYLRRVSDPVSGIALIRIDD